MAYDGSQVGSVPASKPSVKVLAGMQQFSTLLWTLRLPNVGLDQVPAPKWTPKLMGIGLSPSAIQPLKPGDHWELTTYRLSWSGTAGSRIAPRASHKRRAWLKIARGPHVLQLPMTHMPESILTQDQVLRPLWAVSHIAIIAVVHHRLDDLSHPFDIWSLETPRAEAEKQA